MKLPKFLNTMMLALTLAGCAGLPTQAEISAADYGPFPSDADVVVKAYYARTLKDPDSAHYSNIGFPVMWYDGNRLGDRVWGWKVCVTLNAKNSYGAYVGYETEMLLIRDERVVRAFKSNDIFIGKNFPC